MFLSLGGPVLSKEEKSGSFLFFTTHVCRSVLKLEHRRFLNTSEELRRVVGAYQAGKDQR